MEPLRPRPDGVGKPRKPQLERFGATRGGRRLRGRQAWSAFINATDGIYETTCRSGFECTFFLKASREGGSDISKCSEGSLYGSGERGP